MDLTQTIALCMGAAWASGINLYAALLMLGLMGATGHMQLPPGLEVLQEPPVIMAAGFMYCVEFFADKVPGVDTGWDTVHTFLRIPAGAILAATAVGDVSMAAQVAAAIVGGTLAGVSHATKAGGRVMINTSPEPVSNWTVSIAEDLAVFGGLWTALNYPGTFLALLAVFLVFVAWLLPKIWRGVSALARRLASLLRGAGDPGVTPRPGAAHDPQLRFSLTAGPSRDDEGAPPA